MRKTINKFINLDLIRVSYDKSLKQFDYEINTNIETKRSNIISGSYQDQNNITSPLTNSSSSSTNNTTTKDTEIILTTHPELGYWRQKNLTVKQMNHWLKTTGSQENLIQSLCHCRFEMVDLGLEESKPIENVFNWFFRMIERTGSYPEPTGYKSFQEKQIEKEQRIIKEKEKRIHDLKELSRKKYEQEREEKFWEMMNDQGGDLYRQCHGNLNKFEKNLKGGPVFEKSMRKAFDEIMNKMAQKG